MKHYIIDYEGGKFNKENFPKRAWTNYRDSWNRADKEQALHEPAINTVYMWLSETEENDLKLKGYHMQENQLSIKGEVLSTKFNKNYKPSALGDKKEQVAGQALAGFTRHGQFLEFDDTPDKGGYYIGDGKDYYATDNTSVPFPAYNPGGFGFAGKAYSKEAFESGLIDVIRAGFDGTGVKTMVLDSGVRDCYEIPMAGGWDFINNNSNYKVDGFGHGTPRCHEFVGRPSTGGVGVWGNSPGASMHMGKMIGDNGSFGSSDAVVGAINYAIENRIHIISMSWAGGYDIERWLQKYVRSGGWAFASAGNLEMNVPPQQMLFPASARSVIACGATVGGIILKRDLTRYMANQRLETNGKLIDLYGYYYSLIMYNDGRLAHDAGTSNTSPSLAAMAACYRSWLFSKKQDQMSYQFLAEMNRRWTDRAPDGRPVVGNMRWMLQ